MKRFVIPGLLAVLIVLGLGVGARAYTAIHAPDIMGEAPVTWEGTDGAWLQTHEAGAVEGQLPLATGELIDFRLGWREAYGEGFADEDFQELLFTAGLRAWGQNRLVFEIETDQVGLSADRYSFHRAE